MQRIPLIEAAKAPAAAQELLGAVKRQMGGVPNILGTMAQSPAALGGYLGFAGALGGGKLSVTLREQIALTVAGANACDYCASVHTALAQKAGVSAAEANANLYGRSDDAKARVVLSFVRDLTQNRGQVSDGKLSELRNAGFDDEAVVEIVANVALNIFTNYFNHVAGTDIDFPLVESRLAAAA